MRTEQYFIETELNIIEAFADKCGEEAKKAKTIEVRNYWTTKMKAYHKMANVIRQLII